MRDMVRVPGGAPGGTYQAPKMRLGRSQFNHSHNHKTTFDAGRLIPYLCREVIPGDTMTCKLLSFVRIFSPLDAPIMDNIEIGIDFFFVPNRLVWDNWAAFLGEHDAAGAQDTDYTMPVLGVTAGAVESDDLASYFGIPIGLEPTVTDVNALPFRGYRKIYNEWYRDQNIIDEVTVPTDDGSDSLTESGWGSGPLKSAKKPDYFTTALPYLQKGDPSSTALSGTLNVRLGNTGSGGIPGIYVDNLSQNRALDSDGALVDVSATGEADNLYVDLADGVGVTITALREAAAIQRLLEKDARAGTRHPEIIREHFGVDVPDYRIQRTEYLGGGRGFVNVTPVANTSDTVTYEQGQLAGVGAGRLTASFAKSFVEHGFVFGILRARAEVSYQQGLDRMWSRSTKFDLLWPELAQLGEQPIYNKELWIEGDSTDDDVFGYQERYADYRFSKSLVTGKFASDATGSLDFWHLSEDFAAQPTLSQAFIEDQSPMSRVVTVTTEPDFIIDGRFDLRIARALPVRPTPSLAPARF